MPVIDLELLCRIGNGNLVIAITGFFGSELVGYIAFSPVTLNGKSFGLGLAPVAVAPNLQSRGLGDQLVRAGLEHARESGESAIVVLGEPSYYGRFGFDTAAKWGLRDEYGGGSAFQAMEFNKGYIPAGGGLIRSGKEFEMV